MGQDAGAGMRDMRNAGGGMADEGGMTGADASGTAMPTLLTRDQLRAFQARYITGVIRLDLVEFIAAEQPEE